ncbi:MAG: rod shape-determining protein MreC [Bacillota bacterium]
MRRTWLRKTAAGVILFGVICAAMHLTTDVTRATIPLEGTVRDLLAPVQRGALQAGRVVQQGMGTILSLGRAERVERLEKQVRQLEGKIAELNEYRVENTRLRRLLGFREETRDRYELLAADVIGRDPGNWFGTITLDRGAADGVRSDMPVLLPEGLVGRVLRVSQRTAVVLLLTDPRSGVGGTVQETRTPGVLRGVVNSYGQLRMTYLAKDAPVKIGQLVVTSGLGGIFPRGVPLGRIVSVRPEPTGLTKEALVQPLVDFSHLEEVFILLRAVPGG